MTPANYFVHESSIVDDGAQVGDGTKIWHFAHIFGGAKIGENCSFGQNTMVADDVIIGNNVKVQNNVAIYGGTTIEDDVFLGPSCVLTNVSNPRSQVVRRAIYEKTLLRKGTTIGANATIVCGLELGRYTFVAAGAVVTKSTRDYEMVVGVPAKRIGWMSRHGHPLAFGTEGTATCPESGLKYEQRVSDGEATVRCLDLDEDAPLPENLAVGSKAYREF